MEWRGMYVSPSFSATYSLIELSDVGKSSVDRNAVEELWLSPSICCDDRRSSGAFSVCSVWVTVDCVVLVRGGWMRRFGCCLWSSP